MNASLSLTSIPSRCAWHCGNVAIRSLHPVSPRWVQQGSRAAHNVVPACSSSTSSTGASQEEIAARIVASRRRRAAMPTPLQCPACSIRVGTPAAMMKHLAACCPDLISGTALSTLKLASEAGDREAVGELLQAATGTEAAARQEAIRITFRTGEMDPVTGQPCRHSTHEVAQRMGLPEKRASELLSRAMRAYPMPADPEPVDVLFEDEDLIAVNKPPGLNTAPAHRYRGGSMLNRLIGHLGRPPLTLHRLDMDTSGVLLFAKSHRWVETVAVQFRNRSVAKCYLAICIGVPDQARFEVRSSIGRHPTEAVARMTFPEDSLCTSHTGRAARPSNHGVEGPEVLDASEAINSSHTEGYAGLSPSQYDSTADSSVDDEREFSRGSADPASGPVDLSAGTLSAGADAQQAWTSCYVLASNSEADLSKLARPGLLFDPSHQTHLQGASLIACRPHSGRTHQIRVHCQNMGHPLIGDELYGVLGPWISRQALHAATLVVEHPGSKAPLVLTAALPEDMQEALRQLGIPAPHQLEELPRFFN